MRPLLEEMADKTLDRVCEALNDDPHVRRVAVADLTPARALERIADEQDAALIVVGPSHLGHLGRLHPGSTADRCSAAPPARSRWRRRATRASGRPHRARDGGL